MIGEGFLILTIGLGMVFLFFAVLTIAMRIIAVIVNLLNKVFPEKVPENQKPAKTVHLKTETHKEAHIALAIAAARRKLEIAKQQ